MSCRPGPPRPGRAPRYLFFELAPDLGGRDAEERPAEADGQTRPLMAKRIVAREIRGVMLEHVVIDELYAFIGAERGRQLQSLLHRIEVAVGRSIPRVALSATLGDMALAAEFLRPGRSAEVHRITS